MAQSARVESFVGLLRWYLMRDINTPTRKALVLAASTLLQE